ncbi:MAG: tetratricopeptide repeat protein [Deltaproteobacteria bacterium]|nr:tetratricopeptide repeat protein [Deltaproteobacteria bacterium]
MLNKARQLIFILVALITTLLLPGSTYSEEIANISKLQIEKAPTLEDAREVLSTYHKDGMNIDRSMEITNKILEKDPDNVEALIFLSRVWLTYGYVRERTKEGKIRSFETGKDIAERTIEIAPANPDAHFFYVANLALVGEAKGIFSSLFILPKVRRELDQILELDPNHAYGLAMNGALYYHLPGILGGDMEISEIYMRRALSVNPHMSSAKLYLAMNLRKQKRYDEAIEVLLELVNDREPSFYPDWYLNRRYAIVLISKIREQQK